MKKVLKSVGIIFLIGAVGAGALILLFLLCPDFNMVTGSCG